MAHHHHHDHDHFGHSEAGHGHTHGVVDPSIVTTAEGLWALKWSFVVLMATALLQVAVVFVSGSVGLLADTIHNFGDAATAIPLGIAFLFARKRPTKRFTFGYGRVEDLAGLRSFSLFFLVRLLPVTRALIGFSIRRIFRISGRLLLPRSSVFSVMRRSRFSASALDAGLAARP